jgi:hypothetical protein
MTNWPMCSRISHPSKAWVTHERESIRLTRVPLGYASKIFCKLLFRNDGVIPRLINGETPGRQRFRDKTRGAIARSGR